MFLLRPADTGHKIERADCACQRKQDVGPQDLELLRLGECESVSATRFFVDSGFVPHGGLPMAVGYLGRNLLAAAVAAASRASRRQVWAQARLQLFGRIRQTGSTVWRLGAASVGRNGLLLRLNRCRASGAGPLLARLSSDGIALPKEYSVSRRSRSGRHQARLDGAGLRPPPRPARPPRCRAPVSLPPG